MNTGQHPISNWDKPYLALCIGIAQTASLKVRGCLNIRWCMLSKPIAQKPIHFYSNLCFDYLSVIDYVFEWKSSYMK